MKDFAARVGVLDVEGAFGFLVRASALERAGRTIIHLARIATSLARLGP
ncbi:MAG: hypothetical protein V3U14_03640 [candidate division NC10 bacterium]